MLYLVTWKISIEAETPKQAAKKALEIQRDKKSIATVFEVEAKNKNHVIDLAY